MAFTNELAPEGQKQMNVFEETLSVYGTARQRDVIVERLLTHLERIDGVSRILEQCHGLDPDNEFDLEAPQATVTDPTAVHTITVTFALVEPERARSESELDALSEKIFACVRYAVAATPEVDYFSFLSPREP